MTEPDTESGSSRAEIPATELPDAVARKLVALAADSLTSLPTERVPTALRRVAKFAAAKRAKAGFGPLLTSLEADPVFRSHVAEFSREAQSRHVAARSPFEELIEAAAQASLLRLPDAATLLEKAGAAEQLEILRGRLKELTLELERARASRSQAEAERDGLKAERDAARQSVAGGADLDKLRGRLREQGTAIREMKDRLEGMTSEAAEDLVQTRRDLVRARAEIKALQDRLDAAKIRGDRATAQLQSMASEAATGALTADRRVELLLETAQDAVAGIRRQLRLRQGGAEPADAVADQLPMTVRPTFRAADSVLLAEWLTLPQAHLIVDGYNVSKTGYPAMTLADQRERLLRGLAALAARTSCEVTLVFDGAAVVAPQSRVRGVRVIFSPPGVIADEVIRRLVVAEPLGRVLIVATADKEILVDVVSSGARTVTPLVLLALM